MVCKTSLSAHHISPLQRVINLKTRNPLTYNYGHSARNDTRWVLVILCAPCVKCEAHRADIRRSQMFEKYADIRRNQMFEKYADNSAKPNVWKVCRQFGEAKCLKSMPTIRRSQMLEKGKQRNMLMCQNISMKSGENKVDTPARTWLRSIHAF